MEKVKMLFYDLEVSRAIVEGYGTKWDFKVIRILQPQTLMCYAYKWHGEKKTHFVSIHDFDSYRDFISSLADLLSEADIAVAYNGIDFDNKMANTFFIKEDIQPPAPYRTIDPLKVARGKLKLMSNSLNDLAEYLGLGKKEKITYEDIGSDFLNNPNPKSIRLMEKYNKQDVDLLEAIYLKLRPYITAHPNLAVIERGVFACTYCGSKNVQSRGLKHTNAGSYRQYSCNDCGGWPADRSMIKGTSVQLRST